MFDKIREIIETDDVFACVLIGWWFFHFLVFAISLFVTLYQNTHKHLHHTTEETIHHYSYTDEIESLTAARKAALGGNEPSDALRVVNAVLTQLDKLKTYKNVIVLTTTNITQVCNTRGNRGGAGVVQMR